jgi:hypothetical protein
VLVNIIDIMKTVLKKSGMFMIGVSLIVYILTSQVFAVTSFDTVYTDLSDRSVNVETTFSNTVDLNSVTDYGFLYSKSDTEVDYVSEPAYYFSMDLGSNDYLTLVAQNKATGAYRYQKALAGNGAVVNTGDTVEYDVRMSHNVSQIGGIDIRFTNGAYARDNSGWIDQNGIRCHPNYGIGSYAYGKWFTRKCIVPSSFNGLTIGHIDFVNEADNSTIYTVDYDNFVVRDSSGNLKKVIYDNGSNDYNAFDLSSNAISANISVNSNLSSVQTDGKFGKSLYFENNPIKYNLDDFDISSGFAFDFWIYINSSSTSADLFNLYSSSTGDNIVIKSDEFSENLDYEIYSGSTLYDSVTIPNVLPKSEWVNVALVASDGELSVYSNGVNIYTDTFIDPELSFKDVLEIGSGLYGSVDEVRLFDRSLNQTEVSSLYGGGNGYLLKKISLSPSELNQNSFNYKLRDLDLESKYYVRPYLDTGSLLLGNSISFTTLATTDVSLGSTEVSGNPTVSANLITDILYDNWADIESYGYLLSLSAGDFVSLAHDYVYVSMDSSAGVNNEYLNFTSDNNSYSYYSSWKAMNIDNVLIQAGDVLYYDVYMYHDKSGVGGVQLSTSGGNASMTDQYGILCQDRASDISDYAYGQWFSRECTIDSSYAGQRISLISLINADPAHAYIHALYDNILIKDVYGNIKKVVYESGEPDYTSTYLVHEHTWDSGTITKGTNSTIPSVEETNSVQGNSYSFDGSSTYLDIDISDLDLTSEYSVSFWIHTPSSTGNLSLIDFGNDYFVSWNSGSEELMLSRGEDVFVNLPLSFGADEWKHVLISESRSETLQVYVDDVLVGENTLDYPFDSSPSTLRLGDGSSSGNGADHFSGLIDELFVIESLLGNDERNLLFDNAAGFNDSTIEVPSESLSTEDFSTVIEDLDPETQYFVRPFVKTGNRNYVLGNTYSFTTLSTGNFSFNDISYESGLSNYVNLTSDITFDNWVSVSKYGYFVEKTNTDFNVVSDASIVLNMDTPAGEAGEYLDFVSDNMWTGGSSWKALDLDPVTIEEGDVLVYQTQFYKDHEGQGGILMRYTDGSLMNGIDQNEISCNSTADLSDYAYRTWFERECSIASSDIGKTPSLIIFPNGKTDANIHVLYDTILLKDRDGNIKATFYTDGDPDYTSSSYSISHVWDSGTIKSVSSDHIPSVEESVSVLNNSYLFNGINDFVSESVKGLDIQNGYSMSFWVNSSDLSSTDTLVKFNEDMFLLANLDTDQLTFYANNPELINANADINDNTWHHIAFTQDSNGRVIIYLDGTIIAQQNVELISFDYITLGVGSDQGDFYDGYMDEFLFFDHTISANEVDVLYNSNSNISYTMDTVYLDAPFSGSGSFNKVITNLDAHTSYSIKPFAIYGGNKFAVGDYITFTTGGINETPITGNDQISYSSNFYAGKEQSIVITYKDGNGVEDMDRLYFKIQNPAGEDIEYYVTNTGVSVTNQTPKSVSGSKYVESFKYSLQNNGSELIVTWKPTLDWDWFESSDLKIGMKATDKGTLSTEYSYTTTTYTYENDLVFYGTLTLTGSRKGLIQTGESVYSDERVTWSGVRVVYQGTTNIYPDNSDFDVLLIDENGRSWLDTESSGRNISIVETFAGTNTALDHDLYIVNTPTGVSIATRIGRELRVVPYISNTNIPDTDTNTEEDIPEDENLVDDKELKDILKEIKDAKDIKLKEDTKVVNVEDLDDENQIIVEVGNTVKDTTNTDKEQKTKLKVVKDNKVYVHENEDILISAPVEATGELQETEVVVAEFNDEIYVMELNEEGTHYEATISTVGVEGTKGVNIYVYDIESKLANQAYTMSLQIDPYGYVYEMRWGQQVRVENAEVNLYVMNNGEWSLYEAEDVTNPQYTNMEGEYSFYVEPGIYMFKVVANGYQEFESDEIVVEEHIIEYNIQLERDWNIYWYISGGIIALIITTAIILVFNKKKKQL